MDVQAPACAARVATAYRDLPVQKVHAWLGVSARVPGVHMVLDAGGKRWSFRAE